jgi:hypothetical protein
MFGGLVQADQLSPRSYQMGNKGDRPKGPLRHSGVEVALQPKQVCPSGTGTSAF